MFLRWVGVAVGLIIIYAGAAELVSWLRARRRLTRTTGVIVGSVDAATRPGVHQRSGVFRFTTEDGRVIETASAASTPRGPKVGRQVTVLYDPLKPEDADVRGVRIFKVIFSPVLIAGGVALAAYSAFGAQP